MTHSTQTAERTRAPLRLAAVAMLLGAAAVLGACALEPGRPYDFSQVNGGYQEGYAQTHNGTYGFNNAPTYYPR